MPASRDRYIKTTLTVEIEDVSRAEGRKLATFTVTSGAEDNGFIDGPRGFTSAVNAALADARLMADEHIAVFVSHEKKRGH